MLLMIRINLIGTTKGRRRRTGMPDIPNVGVLLFVLLLVIEGAILYSWHAGAQEQSRNVEQKLSRYRHELEVLRKTNEHIEALRKEITEVKKNTWAFNELTAEKVGPVDALSFLSWIFLDRDEATHPTEELKQMEAAGWRVGWEAKRAWLTSVREAKGEVTIVGQAMGHSDVAEVLRRLESSAHFREVRLMFQEVKTMALVNARYVEFTIKASLVYLIEPIEKPETEVQAKPEPAAPLRPPSAAAPPRDLSLDAESPLPVAATTSAADASLLPEAVTSGAGAASPGEAAIGTPSMADLMEAK